MMTVTQQRNARETSILSIHRSGRRALTVLAADCVEYSVMTERGEVVWTCTVADGPRAQAHREAANREQQRRLEGRQR
jgi:hypothetical protein